MSRPGTQMLQDLLHTHQARAWLERLTACFFDRDAKKAVLDGVRASLPSLAPELDPDALEQLTAGLIQELCRQASRDATPPATADEPGPVLLAGPDLEDRIFRDYPYPVAAAYHALAEQDNAAAGFGCLLDTFEALVHFLATVAVSAYLRTGLPSHDCNRFLLEMLLKGAWSTGDLFALLRDTARLAGDCGGHLPYPLPACLFTPKGKPTAAHQVLESFVSLRNRRWGHAAGRTEAAFAEVLPPNRKRLEEELARMPWLADWRLIRPVALDADGTVTVADLLNGCLRRKARPFALALEPRDRPDGGGDVRADRDALLLVAPDGAAYLPLFPLSLFQFRAGPRGQGAYFLQRCRWQTEPAAWRLAQAAYVAYEGGLPEHEEGPREFVAGSLERQLGRLRAGLPEGAVPAARAEQPAGDPDHALPEVFLEQQSHLKAFVGREQTLADVAAWIDRQAEGRYLLVLGPPGQGKSALMAELARREAGRGGCLLHMVKSHPRPGRFVPALISQAAKLAGVSFGAQAYVGDTDDLRNAWVRSLEAVVRAAGRAVVVLDALDELEAGDGRVTFLSPGLPAGARVVLSCRPDIPLVQALRGRLRGRLDERPLEPLSEADFRLLLERRMEASVVRVLEQSIDLGQVFHRLGGNPLFVQCCVDDLVRRREEAGQTGEAPAVDLGALPTTLEAVFRGVYDRVRRGEGGRQRARLLQLLVAAREPLSITQLAGLMAVDGQPLLLEDCRDQVEALSQWLLDAGEGRFKPWHQGLADYLREQVLGAAGVVQLEDVFCRWLEQPGLGLSLYGLKHRLGHLVVAGRASSSAEVLLDLRFLEAKVEAGLLFELVGDFTRVEANLQATDPRRTLLRLLEEALRRDLHFLARHPRALFQCLWNSCWWYDCPQAAEHYAPPTAGWPPEGPPWEGTGPRLYTLLESWRKEKAACGADLCWARSLRPPPTHLGTAQRAVLQGGEGEVTHVAVSADGRRIISGAADGTVRVWDAGSGQPLACLRARGGAVNCVAVTPDGRLVIAGVGDGFVQVWGADNAEEVLHFRAHYGVLGGVGVSPDGRRIVTGGGDYTLGVWDANSGANAVRFDSPDGWVTCLAVSPDGRRVVSAAGRQGTLVVWDVSTGEAVFRLGSCQARVKSVTYSPDGRQVVGASGEALTFWDSETGRRVRVLSGHAGPVTGVAYCPDESRVVSGGADGTVRIWDVGSGRELACLRGHEKGVSSVAWSPNGQWIVSGSEDGTVRQWNTRGGGELAPLTLHTEGEQEVRFSEDGRWLVTTATEQAPRRVRVWHAESGRLLSAHLRGPALGVRFSPDGRHLATWFADGTTRVVDAQSGQERHSLCMPGGVVSDVCYSPDGRWLYTWDREVAAWETDTGELKARFLGHAARVAGVRLAQDGRRLLSWGADGTARAWEVSTGRELLRLPSRVGSDGELSEADGGRVLVFWAAGRALQAWDALTGEELACFRELSGQVLPQEEDVPLQPSGRAYQCDANHVVRIVRGSDFFDTGFVDGFYQTIASLEGHEAKAYYVADFLDRRQIVTAANDGTVRVWGAERGEPIACLRGHEGLVRGTRHSPDGRRIAALDSGRTVWVWDLDAAGAPARIALESLPRAVGFSPDGLQVVILTEDATLRVWDLERGRWVRSVSGLWGGAAGRQGGRPLWEVRDQDRETVIAPAATRQPVAWLPARLRSLAASPSGRLWVGWHEEYLYILRIEGAAGSDEGAVGHVPPAPGPEQTDAFPWPEEVDPPWPWLPPHDPPQAGRPVGSENALAVFSLEQPQTVLGRDPSCDIVLNDRGVSRRHALILRGGNVVIQDLASSNGTFVRERKIEAAAVLVDGDLIRVGGTLLRFDATRRCLLLLDSRGGR